MTDTITKNIVRFIVLILFQVLILNNILLGGYINPYLYIVFILMLPFRTPNWLLLIFSFAMGISIDMFSDTIGMHAAACLFAAFIRPFTINYVYTKDDYEYITQPSVKDMGLYSFLTYAAIITFVHHFALFYIEAFRFADFFSTLLRVILSSLFTIVLIIITQYVFVKEKKKK
ncbi:MAG: rod shape-determining protein MreD [Bacteroidales bacterium]|jgi:rod shape-determining protein MreD